MSDFLDQNLLRLEVELPWARAAFDQLGHDGFTITDARRIVQRSWLVRAAIPPRLQQRFGLAPELHAAVVERLQARDVSRAYDEAVHSDLRVDTDLMLVIGPNAEMPAQVARVPGHGQRVAWIPPFTPLEGHLAHSLPRQDLFDERNPVRGAAVIGRRMERTALRQRLDAGGATAVLGLRKVGKTTLAHAVIDQTDSSTLVAWVDLQRVTVQDLLRGTISDLAGQLGLLLRDDRPGLPNDPLERLKALVNRATVRQKRVCIVIDEFDLFFEGDNAPRAEPLRTFFGLLRGLSQDGASLALLLLGRDPALLSAPRMGAATNPLLGWVREYWLGPMSQNGANDLLHQIGRRVGIEVTAVTQAAAYGETGGHPLLHRQYGSALLAMIAESGGFQELALVDSTPHTERALKQFRSSQAVRDVGAEVSTLLGERYPQAREIAVELTHEHAPTVWEIYGRDTEAQRILTNFGLLLADGSLVPWLRWYLARFLPSPTVRRAG